MIESYCNKAVRHGCTMAHEVVIAAFCNKGEMLEMVIPELRSEGWGVTIISMIMCV